MVTFRDATRADVATVLAFWNDATTVASSTDDVAGVETLLAHDPRALILACDGDAIVGTVITGWDGWRGAMYRLAVAPSWRRRGIARTLVAEAEARLVARGARRLHLIVQRDEAPARAFWSDAGYKLEEQDRFVKTLPGA